MNIGALVISVFSAIASFVYGDLGTLLSQKTMTLVQFLVNSTRGSTQTALLVGIGAKSSILIAAIIAIIGGILAYHRKKSAPIILAVSAGLCVLAGLIRLEDGFVWGILYAIAAVCAHADMQKQREAKMGDSDTTDTDTPRSTEAVVHIRKRTVVHEPIVGVETVALVKRAFLFLEDGGFDEADRYIEQALNQDPENAKAYIGRLMVNLSVKQEEELQNQSAPLTGQSEYAKALRFADEGYKSVLVGYNQRIVDRAGKETEQKSRKNEEERINAENLRLKTEEESKGKIYDEAVSSKNESEKSDDFREIAEKFRSLGSFKDSEALAIECDELANKAQIVEEKHKAKNNKIIMLLVVVALVAAIAMLFINENEKMKIATATARLFEVSQNGTAQQIEAAIKDGADINAKDKNGNTVFDYAKHNAKIRGTEIYKTLSGNPARRYMVSTGDNVRVREAPNPKANSSSVIPTIDKGNVVLVVEEKRNSGEDYPWRRIVQEGYDEEYPWGWVYGQFLRETIEKKNVDMGLDTLNGIAWGTQHSKINGLPALVPAREEQDVDWNFESIVKGDYREKGIYLPKAEIAYLFDVNRCLMGAIVTSEWKEGDKNLPKIYSFLEEKLGETQNMNRDGDGGEGHSYKFGDFKVSFGYYGDVNVVFHYRVIKKK